MMLAYKTVFFLAVPGMCAVIALAVYRYRWLIKTVALLGTQQGQLRYFSYTRKVLQTILVCIGCIALFVACMRPQRDGSSVCSDQRARDIVVVLDISRSMLAQDIAPTRLEAARLFIKNVVNTVPSDRVALIVFSGQAVCLCPLTRDHDSFFTFLQAVDTSTIGSGSTDYGPAFKQLIEVARQGGKRQTLALLVTDGEDFSPDLSSLKEELKQHHIIVYTVGVGTREGAPIALYNEQGVVVGHHKDRQGAVVISRLCPDLLRQLSEATGAHYLEGVSQRSVEQLCRDLAAYEKERDAAHAPEQRCQEELYGYPAAVSLICFLGAWLL